MLKKVKHSLRAKALKKFLPEILIFLFAGITRFWRLDFPPAHYFDEVYHAFTAQEMFRGNPAAWEWWNTPPQGFAYEWTHPPLAKEFMWLSISIFGDNPFAWRFFSAVFGTGIIVLIYFISLHIFKSRRIALLSSFVASLSGLLLVMSRIAMNDNYFLFFSLLAILMFLKDKKLLMGMFLGLSFASKWTAMFTILMIGYLYVLKFMKIKQFLVSLIISPVISLLIHRRIIFLLQLFLIPAIIYFAAYFPFFLQKHSPPGQNLSNLQTFIGLQKQMYWYHTRLTATHPYQSRPEQWVLDLRPVWLFVDYRVNTIASIYTLENPLIAWFGLFSVFYLLFQFLKKRSLTYLLAPLFYFGFFILWIRSPRIMFNYHYLASTAFLAIALGFTLNELRNRKNTIVLFAFLLLLVALFIYFYPLWTGIHIPKNFSDSHFWLQSWK